MLLLERMRQRGLLLLLPVLLWVAAPSAAGAFTSTPFGLVRAIGSNNNIGGTSNNNKPTPTTTPTPLTMSGTGEDVSPITFREAEVLGLKFMQQRKFEEALKGE